MFRHGAAAWQSQRVILDEPQEIEQEIRENLENQLEDARLAFDVRRGPPGSQGQKHHAGGRACSLHLLRNPPAARTDPDDQIGSKGTLCNIPKPPAAVFEVLPSDGSNRDHGSAFAVLAFDS